MDETNGVKYKLKKFLKKRQTIQCMIGIVACIISLYMNLVVCNLIVYQINRTIDQDGPLRDILFDIMPNLEGYNFIAVDMPFFIFLIFLAAWFLMDSQRIKIVTAVTYAVAIIYFIRSLCILFTIMPPTMSVERIDVNIKSIWFFNAGVSELYGDCIFSGHVASATIFFFAFVTYIGGRKLIIPTILLALIWIYLCIMVIMTRMDYSSDVTVALFITMPTFSCIRLWIKKYHISEQKRDRKSVV